MSHLSRSHRLGRLERQIRPAWEPPEIIFVNEGEDGKAAAMEMFGRIPENVIIVQWVSAVDGRRA